MWTMARLMGAGAAAFIPWNHYDRMVMFPPYSIASWETIHIIGFSAIVLGASFALVLPPTMARMVLHTILLGWVGGMAGLVGGLGLTLAVWSGTLGFLGPLLVKGFINARDQSSVTEVLVRDATRLKGLASQVLGLEVFRIIPLGH